MHAISYLWWHKQRMVKNFLLIFCILTTIVFFLSLIFQAGGFPEPEIIHYNPKDFDFGKKKSFPFRDQVKIRGRGKWFFVTLQLYKKWTSVYSLMIYWNMDDIVLDTPFPCIKSQKKMNALLQILAKLWWWTILIFPFFLSLLCSISLHQLRRQRAFLGWNLNLAL